MNRAQRRAAAKRANHAGRVTPKQQKAPTAFVTVQAEDGTSRRIEIQGEPVSPEEMEALQRHEAQQKEAQMRLQAHARGMWLPGDPIQ